MIDWMDKQTNALIHEPMSDRMKLRMFNCEHGIYLYMGWNVGSFCFYVTTKPSIVFLVGNIASFSSTKLFNIEMNFYFVFVFEEIKGIY